MVCLTGILLLAIASTAASQCEYVYVAEPPSGQLICDPFQLNNGQLQLVCSIFVTEISQLPDVLRIQWFFSAPVNTQFNPTNAVLIQDNSFRIAQRQTYTSRIVVSSPPSGFYFCQPILASGRQLIRSIVATLQIPSFYQQRQTRPCLINEFQNSSIPFCAQQGVTLGPNQIIAPATTVVETLQSVPPTQLSMLVIPTPVLELETASPVAVELISTDSTGLIAGVVVGALFIVIIAVLILVSVLILILMKKRKFNSEHSGVIEGSRISNSERYTTTQLSMTVQSDGIQDVTFAPPHKPPPKLRRLTFGTKRSPQVTNNHYSRLRFPKTITNETSQSSGIESSAYYITPENNGDGIEYYVDYDEEQLDRPYVDESESLVYNDSQYSTESDLHLHQQKKHQTFVTSSSLELESDVHAQAAQMINAGRKPPYPYQNYVPKRKKEKVAKLSNNESPQHQNTFVTKELRTGYVNAEVLENSTVV